MEPTDKLSLLRKLMDVICPGQEDFVDHMVAKMRSDLEATGGRWDNCDKAITMSADGQVNLAIIVTGGALVGCLVEGRGDATAH